MVLRNGPDGLETLMMRRAATLSFVAGATVFPGGAHHPGDGAPDGSGLTVTAIRETFEEAGLVLAVDASGEVAGPGAQTALADRRADVHHGRAEFDALLAGEGLRAAIDAVHPWGRWVTPLGSTRRYDTRFFVAACPPGQEAMHDDHEMVEHRWITPARALDLGAAGELLLILPTRKSLESLRRFPTADDVLDAAIRSRGWSVPAVIPAAHGDVGCVGDQV
jgi:8-oxo-dGTP pyrophosphatase MutT (NUDIX family)